MRDPGNEVGLKWHRFEISLEVGLLNKCSKIFRLVEMLLGTIYLMPGLWYRLLIGLWTNFIAFNCQVVEQKKGMSILLFLPLFWTVLYDRYIRCNAMSCWRFPKELGLPCGETWPPKIRGVVLLWVVENLSALKGICMEGIKKLSRKLRKTPQLPPPETKLEIGQMPEGGITPL